MLYAWKKIESNRYFYWEMETVRNNMTNKNVCDVVTAM